jgi:hypothetical protein
MRPPRLAPPPICSVVSRFGWYSKLAVALLRSMYGEMPPPNVMFDANAPKAAPTRNLSKPAIEPSALHWRTPVGPTGGERPQARASRATSAQHPAATTAATTGSPFIRAWRRRGS